MTIIVSRMDDDKLDVRRNRAERRDSGKSNRADRSARVAASKGEEVDAPAETSADEEETTAAVGTLGNPAEGDNPYGDGSHVALDDDSMPEGFPVKGNADSGKFHQPDGRWYENTVAEVWFADADAATAAGFTEAGTKAKATDSEEEE